MNLRGTEANNTALENLQRGFDFYSWLTFIALNSPADGRSIEQIQSGHPNKMGEQE